MLVDIALNVAAQIFFFIICIFIIPWVGNLITDKNSDVEKMIQKYEECENEEKKERLRKSLSLYQKWIDFAMTVDSWTHGLLRTLVQYVILTVTFNHPELKVKIGIGDEDEELDGTYVAKGQLYCSYVYDKSEGNWYNPIKMFGDYLSHVVHVMFSPMIGVALLWLMLPSTFSSIISGFSSWVVLQGNAVGVEFFTCLYNGFVDIAWNRLVLSGFAENPMLLILWIILFAVFLSDAYIIVMKDGRLSPDSMLCLPMTVVILAIANLAFAMISPVYSAFCISVNSIGLALLVIILIKEIASTAAMCVKSALKLVVDKLLPF